MDATFHQTLALLEMTHLVKIFQHFLREREGKAIVNNLCQHCILVWSLWFISSFREKQNHLDPDYIIKFSFTGILTSI